MTDLAERPSADAPLHKPASVSARRRRLLLPAALQILAMVGLGAFVYADAADWFATRSHDSEMSGYVRQVEQLESEATSEMLQQAQHYNDSLPDSVIRDPFADDAGGMDVDEAYRAYEELLQVAGTDVMGGVTYPRLDIALPLYHGTDEDSLTRGAGHLYGTSLPVGGESTHSVITSHSGLVHASLFTPLLDAEVGDTFQVRVLDETHHYRVREIREILPHETEHLRSEPGADLVTLFTCSPIGINTHRFMVTGERIPAPEVANEPQTIGGVSAGFPWWAVIFLAGSALVAALLFAPIRTKQPSGADASDTDAGGAS